MLRELPLQVVQGDESAEVLFLEQGEFHTLKPGTTLTHWSGATLCADAATAGVVLRALAEPGGARDHHVRYTRAIRVEIGYSYTANLEYRTDVEGAMLELHHYAFSTFGDTVAVTREPLPATSGTMRKLTLPFTPAPGTITLFPRIVIPKTVAGTITLRRFNISGYPWGGQRYPEVSADAYRDRNWWEINEVVENSVPVNTGYFGPKARNEFPIRRGRSTGVVWIPAGVVVPFRQGAYTVGIELRELGGGKLLARYAGSIENDRDTAPGQRILLPVATDSCTIDFASWDRAGTLVNTGRLRLYVQRRTPFTEPPDWSGLRAMLPPWPGEGKLSIAMQVEAVSDFVPERKTAGVIEISRSKSGAEVAIDVRDFQRNVVFIDRLSIPHGKGKARTKFSFVAPRPDVYDVTAALFYGDRLIDKRELRIGLRDPASARPFAKPDLPELFLVTEQDFRSLRHAPAAHDQFKQHLEYVKEYGNNTVGIGTTPKDLNPMPGVYRLGEIEERVKMASEAGLKSHIYIVTYMKYWPDWVKREMGLDQDGRPDDLLSIASPAFREVAAALCRELVRHFRSNPDVVSFGMWGAWCEWSYRDKAGRIYDHCPSSLMLWREFAGGIEAPKPLDRGPDLRPEWRQWTAFRTHVLRKWFVESFGETIRKEDPERWLVRYLMAGGQGAMEELYDDFKRLGIYPAHGGSDPSDFRKHGALARQYGLLYRHESVSAPGRHPLQYDLAFFHGLFNGLPESVAPAYNVAWNIGWNVTSKHAGVVRAQERRKQFLDLVTWMYDTGYRMAPNDWAQFQSWDDMVLGGRHFQWYGLAAGLYWADMFEHISYDAVSDRTPLDRWRKYKCVFSYRPRIITAETAERIRAYVRDGGTFGLVMYPGPGMSAVTGTQTPPAEHGRVAATGRLPWFTDGRRLVLDECHAFEPLSGSTVMVVSEEHNTPLAWDVPLGQGHLLLFAGKPLMPESKGFLEDILRRLGINRRFDLVSEEPNDYYPPEALEFVDGAGDVLLLVMRGTRWNNWRKLKAKAPAADPTFDGLATVFPRKEVRVTYYPQRHGPYVVDKWRDGEWVSMGHFSSVELRAGKAKLLLAPAELGALRFRAGNGQFDMRTEMTDDVK